MSDWAETMCALKEAQDEADLDAYRAMQDEILRLRTALATARNDALEEAAKECERPTDGLYKQGLRWREWDECAAAIRSLITKPTIEGE